MCKTIFAVAILLGTLSLVAAEPAAAQVRLVPPGPAVGPTVHGIVRPWMEKEQPPGVMVIVCSEGRVEFFPFGEADRAQRRPVTPESIFELASITKVFTTTSLAVEVDEGRMKLSDPVVRYLPYLAEHGADIRQVTLEQLATHTSSLPRTPEGNPPGGGWTPAALLDWVAQWHAPYPPGTRSLYSNMAVGLLGYAIAQHERQPLLDVWRRQFLDRLDMHHTFFEVPPEAAGQLVQGYGPKGQPVPAIPMGGWPAGGRLSSSGHDMAQFLVANLGLRPDLPGITKAVHLAQRPFFPASKKMTQGLCWQRLELQGERVIDKNGGLAGTSTYIGMLPERRTGMVVMANRGKCAATRVGRELLLALVGKHHRPEGPEEPDQ